MRIGTDRTATRPEKWLLLAVFTIGTVLTWTPVFSEAVRPTPRPAARPAARPATPTPKEPQPKKEASQTPRTTPKKEATTKPTTQRVSAPKPTAPKATPPARPATTAPAAPAVAPTPAPSEEAEESEASVPQGLTVEQLFADFLHFVKLGRFKIANAYGGALLANDKLDPVALLDLADKYHNSVETLITITGHGILGKNAQGILDVIHQGEFARRKDPERIKTNIENLGGAPQVEFNAIQNLRRSGEYAVPWMLSALSNKEQESLHARIIRALPQLDKAGLNPLVVALLGTEDDVLRTTIIQVLGKLGYFQPVPYLKAIVEDQKRSEAVRMEAQEALARIAKQQGRSVDRPAPELFVELAEQYYANSGSVQADPREDIGNIWFWRDNYLQAVVVPRRIFDEVMCMRSCEMALHLLPNKEEAVALWLAGNFRREAELGLSVESEEAVPADAEHDKTRPANFPRSIYFARAFGPHYAQMVLARALKNVEPAVALGAVAALTVTAGADSLIGSGDLNQPLVQALTFPDIVVRTKASIALGNALPKSQFQGSHTVVPVLSQALSLTGQRGMVVVDPGEETRNALQGLIRTLGKTEPLVVAEAQLLPALQRARRELPTVDAIFLATDIKDPDLEAGMATLRREFLFQSVPVILVMKALQTQLAERIAEKDPGVGRILVAGTALPSQQDIAARLEEVASRVGRTPVDEQLALQLAFSATETLRMIAVSNSQVYNFNEAEPALVAALRHPSEELRIKAASVLALAVSDTAQQAVAGLAMDEKQSQGLRIAVFGSLAESAKHNGNKLRQEQIDGLSKQAVTEQNLVIRTAASKALGALNLPSIEASKIIQIHPTGG
jgi:HEAT repeat protein